MTKLLLSVGMALSTVSIAKAADGVNSVWFDETLQSFRTSSTGSGEWITSAGRWMPKDGDKSSCSSDKHKVSLNTCGNELTYRPCTMTSGGTPSTATKYSPYNTLTKVTVNDAVFTAYRGGDEWSCVDSIPLGGLSMRMHDAGDCTFIGWVSTRDGSSIKGRWLELSASGVAAEENVPYTVIIENDYRTVPTRIRYVVNGQPLKDAKGNEWFSIRYGSLDPAVNSNKRATQLGFNGNGSVGEIMAETLSQPTERGSVTMPKIARPVVGSVIDAAAIEVSGADLGTNPNYRWYLIDAAGRPVPGSDRGTNAAYALTENDYGHWVAVDVSDENGFYGTGKFWFSSLPVVYIEAQDAVGWVESDDELAMSGKIYYWVDEEDRFTPLAIEAGTSLAPFRDQYGKLFLENVKTAWPTSKKEDHAAKIYITGNAQYKVQYESDGTLDGDEVIMSKIHVRGNSTAGADKKPYKIKLGKKVDLFGMGGGVKNKHWVLLANCFDESLMRNKLSYDYSGMLGLTYMKSEWVDVVMNGKFVGNYQLCQHIRISEERINIYDWSAAYEKIADAAKTANPELTDDDVSNIEALLEEEQGWMTDGKFSYKGVDYTAKAKGTSGPDGKGGFTVVWKKFSTDISGGYVFELDWKKVGPNATALAPSGFVQRHVGKGSFDFYLSMNTPEFCFTNPDVSNYVWNCWNDIGQAWVSGTGYNAKGQHYTELCDFDSMVAYWLAIQVPGNDDAGGLSRYAYKDQGGKVVFGPAWDFDYGMGSLQIRTRSAAITNEYGEAVYAPIQPEKWIPGAGSQNFMGGWSWDPYFMFKLRQKYLATRQYLADMVKDDGLIDQYKVKLASSARANDLRWNTRIGFFGNAEEKGDADVLKEFLTRRFAWLDKQFETNVGNALPKLTQTAVSSGRYLRTPAIAPSFKNATQVEGSPETDVADVSAIIASAPVEISVVVPTSGAIALDVYVNGLSNGTVAVASQAAMVRIPSDSLKFGERNFLQFVAKNSSGAALANNIALLTAQLPKEIEPGESEGDVPAPVTIEWLDKAWIDLAKKADPNSEFLTKGAPSTYGQYVALARSMSPIGKQMPLWQEFVAGTDPANEGDVFTADIEIGDNGIPVVHWKPDYSVGQKKPMVRSYILRGTNDLATDPKNWDSIRVVGDSDPASEDFRRIHKFFSVEVTMPNN